jgi:hypothetical protein
MVRALSAPWIQDIASGTEFKEHGYSLIRDREICMAAFGEFLTIKFKTKFRSSDKIKAKYFLTVMRIGYFKINLRNDRFE